MRSAPGWSLSSSTGARGDRDLDVGYQAEQIRALGADPVALDLIDGAAVRRTVIEAAPDAIVHQATALADATFSRNFDRTFAQTNRLRTEGSDALLTAAREAGVDRFVAQSFASYRSAREGGPVKTEDDPLDPTRPRRRANRARRCATSRRRSRTPVGSCCATASSTALRTTGWSSLCASGSTRSSAKDAAAATVLALDHDGSGIFNIVHDEPAPAR